MKRGVLVCLGEARTKNIGDYMQSLAAAQFAGAEAVFIEREKLDAYDGAPVKLVMNGWFMHDQAHFPPSHAISPLFVSFHLCPALRDSFFTPETIAYLKRHAPIGCRDRETVEAMTRHGIPAEFTSCLTLTLGRTYRHNPSRDARPLFVDPFFPHPLKGEPPRRIRRFLSVLPWSICHFRVVRALFSRFRVFRLPCNGRRWIRWMHAAEFHRAYAPFFGDDTLLSAAYISHDVRRADFPTDAAMLSAADALMRRYEKAAYVVTSRLHCALPCVAAGVPVWMVSDAKIEKGRFGGNAELVNVLTFGADGRLPRVGGHVPPPNDAFRPLADRLAERVQAFMEDEA